MLEIEVRGGVVSLAAGLCISGDRWEGLREVDRLIEEKGPYKITMPCGEELVLRSLADVPFVDVPCPCGDPTHWLVKYFEKLREVNDEQDRISNPVR